MYSDELTSLCRKGVANHLSTTPVSDTGIVAPLPSGHFIHNSDQTWAVRTGEI